MAIDQECVDYARECVRLASLTKDHDLQAKLLDLARQWMAAAVHEAKAPEANAKTFEQDIWRWPSLVGAAKCRR